MNRARLLLLTLAVTALVFSTGLGAQWNAAAIQAETMAALQALLRLDTTSPGNERRAVEYLGQVLTREGIPYQIFAKDPQRPSLTA